MSRRRQRVDLSTTPDASGIDESQYIAHLEHIQECPLFQYLEQEPKILDHASPHGTQGWKKVSLGPELEYYWHVESGRVSRDCPGEQKDRGSAKEYHALVESLRDDAIRLAQEQRDPTRQAIQTAVVSRMADELLQAYETSSDPASTVEDVWSAVFEVVSKERDACLIINK